MINRDSKTKTLLWISFAVISFAFIVMSTLAIYKINSDSNTNLKSNISQNKLLLFNKVNKDNLKNSIQILEQYGDRTSWKKQNQAIFWARQQLKNFGLESWIETYESKGQQWTNTFARVKGKTKPEDSILIIAHIDSKSNYPEQSAPGADDNGSGVSVLMEVARILKDTIPQESVLFVIFSNEEYGRLGSKAFARKARKEKQNIKAVINLDVLGYNPPKSPINWKFLTTESSFKFKVKTLVKISLNFLSGIVNDSNILIVAGLPKNSDLVKITASSIRSVGGINVKERIESNCY